MSTQSKFVRLVQSYQFPNVWSLEDVLDKANLGIWRDTMFANGALSSEDAIQHAFERDWRIVEVVSEYWDIGPVDPRTGLPVDSTKELIAGHEYRQQRKILEPLNPPII